MDPIFYVGFFVIVISVALVALVSATSVGVASVVVYRWAKRGYREELIDIEETAKGNELLKPRPAEGRTSIWGGAPARG